MYAVGEPKKEREMSWMPRLAGFERALIPYSILLGHGNIRQKHVFPEADEVQHWLFLVKKYRQLFIPGKEAISENQSYQLCTTKTLQAPYMNLRLTSSGSLL